MVMRKIYRDASTGRLVTKTYAEANPGTTVSETVDPKTFRPTPMPMPVIPEEPAVKDGEGEAV